MRVALVHYWIVNWRGGEQVLQVFANLFPTADIYAHVADPALVSRELPGRTIKTSFISQLPLAQRYYQQYLPLMPMALEQLDLRNYDLVLSSESGPAKGVIVSPSTLHICYCHSPMRYLWDMYHDYRENSGFLTRLLMAPMFHRLRLWDQVSAQRVDHYIANSEFVSQRIAKYYRRDSHVIHPPVRIGNFQVSRTAEDWYLWVGQLVWYKRPDLVIEAFNASGRRLVIIGEGGLLKQLRRFAKGNIEFRGRQSFESIREHLSRCRALVFPGVEDFGIVPVEAMASGKPVIAFRKGGALETVTEGTSGIFFDQQTAESLNDAIDRFEASAVDFDPDAIRATVERFSIERFQDEILRHVNSLLASHGGRRSA
jgi:glycosyltransferase involved in cell wall biosynthesis